MSNADSVAQLTLDSFGNSKLTNIKATQLNTAGNAIISMPILSGGLTNGGAVANSGGVIIRRITVQNPTGTVASAYVSISATNDGGNVIVANVALSTVSSTGKYQDLTIASPYTANVVSGYVTQALYVNVNVVSGNANTVEIAVYGDVVSF
jgi:hypothetical protein